MTTFPTPLPHWVLSGLKSRLHDVFAQADEDEFERILTAFSIGVHDEIARHARERDWDAVESYEKAMLALGRIRQDMRHARIRHSPTIIEGD